MISLEEEEAICHASHDQAKVVSVYCLAWMRDSRCSRLGYQLPSLGLSVLLSCEGLSRVSRLLSRTGRLGFQHLGITGDPHERRCHLGG
jgi:hypothetical protein